MGTHDCDEPQQRVGDVFYPLLGAARDQYGITARHFTGILPDMHAPTTFEDVVDFGLSEAMAETVLARLDFSNGERIWQFDRVVLHM